ncbi:MAG TPA: ABC transporter ATP-binding protein [Bryobacteraceae bacterium]|nr:ABC transporter ATP-binding protein [Bryobacteraceae bacterium]
MPGGELAVSVRGLQKRYAAFEAVKGIDFEVGKGEVFGLLGPNGAGKTTTVEILEGLRTRSAGEVKVLGFDPATDRNSLKDRIGVALQSTNLPDKITVGEALGLFASFYSRSVDCGKLLARLQLTEKRDTYYSRLSGGQKQRLALAMALVNDPDMLFLDEPSAGLDPQARLEVHTLIAEMHDERRTVLLTTHYIEEAERLCDRIAIIDEGRIIALGSPREIQARAVAQSSIRIECEGLVPGSPPLPAAAQRIVVGEDGRTITISSRHPARSLVDVVKWIDQHGIDVADVHIKKPSLEDVFIELTGKSLRE